MNISIYLSNEERFKPQGYLICFVKYRKPIKEKRAENWWKSDVNNAKANWMRTISRYARIHTSVYFNYLLILNSLDSRYKNNNKQLKPKQNKIWTYLYTYLMRNGLSLCYLICFVKYRKWIDEKKIKNWQKNEMNHAQLNCTQAFWYEWKIHIYMCISFIDLFLVA